MNINISANKIIKTLGLIIVVLAILSLSTQIYKYFIFNGEDRYIIKMFSLDAEFNFPTLYSSISIFFCSLLLLIIFKLKTIERDPFRVNWIGLTLIFVLLATDEMLVMHEQFISPIRRLLNSEGFLYMAWIIPAIILGIFFLVGYYKFLFSLPVPTRNGFILAGVIFVTGAIGFEAIGGKISSEIGQNNLIYSLNTHVEEILEMVGILLFIRTLLSYLESKYSPLTLQIIKKDNQNG